MDSAQDPVELLMIECLDRAPHEWASAVEAACAAHPEHAAALRERMDVVAQLGKGLKGSTTPEFLGDFQLLERVGGGGMGVVYRARQGSLDRDVALKLIRPDLLWFDRTRERFRRETEAIARLSHPGIVSIFSVGEEGGMPFFAMELLKGATLAEVLKRVAGRAPETLTGRDLWEATLEPGRSLTDVPEIYRGGWPEACLAVTGQVARALAHAHAHGLLHRDVKPSNIVAGADGRAVLIDFGLTGSAESDRERMTRTGAIVGTLVYLPEEQLTGRGEWTNRSDIYSLGATLYELLTLQPAFDGADEAELRSEIEQGRCDPVRARNRRVSEDAQTVCAKAMSRVPADRYASAEAFARDLEAVLARRSIAARPPGALRRGQRWIQRRPMESLAVGAALVAAIGIPSAVAWAESGQASRLARSLTAERAATEEATESRGLLSLALEAERQAIQELRSQAELVEQERNNANKARDMALEATAVQTDVVQYLADVLRGAYPGYHGGEQPGVEQMLAFASAQAEERLGDRPHSRARIQLTLGLVYHSLSEAERAIPHLDRALDILSTLDQTQENVRRDLAQALRVSGRLQLHRGARERGEQEVRRSLQIALDVYEPGDVALFGAYRELGEMLQFLDRREECIEARRLSLDYAETYAVQQPAELAQARADLGFSLFFAKRQLEGEPLIEEGLAGLRKHAPPLDPDFVQTLLRAAKVPRSQGDFEGARELLEEGLVKARALWGETSTAVLAGESELINFHLFKGELARGIEAYVPWLERATEALGPGHPAVVSGRYNYASALARTQRFEDLIALREQLDYPAHTATAWGADAPKLVKQIQELANAYLSLGRLEAGAETLQDLIAVLERIPHARKDLLIQLFTSADLRRRGLHDADGARSDLERMLELAGAGPVLLPLEMDGGANEEVGIRALVELIALGQEKGWDDAVAGWQASLVARRARHDQGE